MTSLLSSPVLLGVKCKQDHLQLEFMSLFACRNKPCPGDCFVTSCPTLLFCFVLVPICGREIVFFVLLKMDLGLSCSCHSLGLTPVFGR